MTAAICLLAVTAPGAISFASSHRSAPLLALDPAASPSDFYLFRSPPEDDAGADTITAIANYWPLQDPATGSSLARFSDDVVYEFKFDLDGDAKEDVTYQITFKTTFTDPKGGLFYARGPITAWDDEDLLVRQTARVVRIDKKGRSEQKDVAVAPAFISDAAYASPPARAASAGAPGSASPSSEENYARIADDAVTDLETRGGGMIFLGPREDPAFADLGALFEADVLVGQGPGGRRVAVDSLAGRNVLTLALQLPIEALVADSVSSRVQGAAPVGGSPAASAPSDGEASGEEAGVAHRIPEHGKKSILGAWTAAYRPRSVTLRPGKSPSGPGSGVQQVARLGLPLLKELAVPLASRDLAESATPREDARKLLELLKAPEYAALLGGALSIAVPPSGRTDLAKLLAFNLGTAPLDVAGLYPADLLRLDLSVPPSGLGAGSRLGLLSGDAGGFPNGRRLADDVVDITLRVLAGALCVKAETCAIDPSVTPLGDGVDQNDRPFLPRFPYLAAPISGSHGAKAAPAK